MNINPEHYFVLCTGQVLKSLDEFSEAILRIDRKTFEFHVTDQKNDFYNWIRMVFKAKKLADTIQDYNYSNRALISKAVKRFLAEKKVLVINSGSSSLKFQLLEMISRDILIKGVVDAINLDKCTLTYNINGETKSIKTVIKNHEEATSLMINTLMNNGLLGDIAEVFAVGHRVVHGGELYTKPTIIDNDVIAKLTDLSSLAPLHNPANIAGIIACQKIIHSPHIAVFDTAFHSTISKEKYMYGLPYEYYEKHHIRKYGFHGSSHKYISKIICEYFRIKKKNAKIIICHLGNGSSITAIKNGKSYNTTMGFTPVDGLIMGTRVGSLDPVISIHMGQHFNLSYEDLSRIFNKQSGLLGISGYSDMRDLRKNQKDPKCRLAIDMYCDRIIHYIGAYIAELNGVDAIVFTAGIGENAHYIRKKILENFKYLGLKLDDKRNEKNDFIITRKDSKIECFVMQTNEELQIAQETMQLLKM